MDLSRNLWFSSWSNYFVSHQWLVLNWKCKIVKLFRKTYIIKWGVTTDLYIVNEKCKVRMNWVFRHSSNSNYFLSFLIYVLLWKEMPRDYYITEIGTSFCFSGVYFQESFHGVLQFWYWYIVLITNRYFVKPVSFFYFFFFEFSDVVLDNVVLRIFSSKKTDIGLWFTTTVDCKLVKSRNKFLLTITRVTPWLTNNKVTWRNA